MTSRRTPFGIALLAIVVLPPFAEAQTLDRAKIPALGPPPKVSLPPIITRELPNGLKLMIVEHHELPVADFVLVIESGGTMDPVAKTGLANLTAAMLTEGTTARSSLQIADQVAFLGIGLNASSNWDASTVSLHTPISQLDSGLALFADVALRPSFPESEFERVRKDRLTSLLQLKDRPTAIANQAYAAILYGSGHPYGRALIGSEVSVQALVPTDIRSYYSSNFVPNNSTLIIVGDVNPTQIEAKIRLLFGEWPRGTVSQIVLTEAPKASGTMIYLIDKPGAAQSSFASGR